MPSASECTPPTLFKQKCVCVCVVGGGGGGGGGGGKGGRGEGGRGAFGIILNDPSNYR